MLKKIGALLYLIPTLMLGGPGFITQYTCYPGCLESEIGQIAIVDVLINGTCSNFNSASIEAEADGFCLDGTVEVVAVNDTNYGDAGVSASTEVYIYEFNPFFVDEYSEGSGISDCQGQFMGDPNTSGDC